MRRFLFDITALVSLVVYLGIIGAFARSLWRSGQFMWQKVEDAPPARYHWYLLVMYGRGGFSSHKRVS